MERIFGIDSIYSEETQNELKQVMLVTEQQKSNISIYGKTGMGKAHGIVVDAWFTGFAESSEELLLLVFSRPSQSEILQLPYWSLSNSFCIISCPISSITMIAKEIAIKLVSDYYIH